MELLKQINEFWAPIAFIIGIVVGLLLIKFKVKILEEKVAPVEDDFKGISMKIDKAKKELEDDIEKLKDTMTANHLDLSKQLSKIQGAQEERDQIKMWIKSVSVTQ